MDGYMPHLANFNIMIAIQLIAVHVSTMDSPAYMKKNKIFIAICRAGIEKSFSPSHAMDIVGIIGRNRKPGGNLVKIKIFPIRIIGQYSALLGFRVVAGNCYAYRTHFIIQLLHERQQMLYKKSCAHLAWSIIKNMILLYDIASVVC